MGKKLSTSTEPIISFDFGGQKYREVIDNLSVSNDDDINPERIRQLLNKAPSKYSYWSAVHADIAVSLRAEQDAFDMWIASKYALQKKEKGDQKYVSEKSKMYEVMITYTDEYTKRTKKLRDLETAKDKAEILVKSFEMQSRTLQTIAALLRAELEMQNSAT